MPQKCVPQFKDFFLFIWHSFLKIKVVHIHFDNLYNINILSGEINVPLISLKQVSTHRKFSCIFGGIRRIFSNTSYLYQTRQSILKKNWSQIGELKAATARKSHVSTSIMTMLAHTYLRLSQTSCFIRLNWDVLPPLFLLYWYCSIRLLFIYFSQKLS